MTRLGRDVADVFATYKALAERGYVIHFVKHPELDAAEGPLGEAIRKAVLAVLAVVAEIERALIRERTIEGMRRARAEGKRVGRKPVEIPVKEVQRLLAAGLSKAAVYRVLVSQGYLYVVEKGVRRPMSYKHFLQRLKALGL